MRHRHNRRYGENLFWAITNGSPIAGDIAVHAWCAEEKDYNYSVPRFSGLTANFTQVIWRDTTKLGVAAVVSPSGTIYVVANYDPPGNYLKSFSENVQRKLSDSHFDSKSNIAKNYAFKEKELLTIKKITPHSNKASENGSISPTSGFTDFQIDCCNAHNDFRNIHGSPPLHLDNTICSWAQERANVFIFFSFTIIFKNVYSLKIEIFYFFRHLL